MCRSESTYELGHEGNHEVEETDGLDEGKAQNGVREELATEGRVAGNGVQEGSEDETDTDTGTSQTDGSRAHADVLGDLDHGLSDLRRVGAALDLEGISGRGLEQGGGLLALEGLERAGRALNRRRQPSIRPIGPSMARLLVVVEPEPGRKKFFLPEMVRLEAAATGARMAGRAALVAIWVARREAKTRVAAIVTVV